MSHNVKKMNDFYDWVTNLGSMNFSNKSALIIGGSEISKQYSLALIELGVNDITIIADKGNNILEFCEEKKIKLLKGGYEQNLSNLEKKDLTIIALPIPKILSALKLAAEKGQNNILIEIKKAEKLFEQEFDVRQNFSSDPIE